MVEVIKDGQKRDEMGSGVVFGELAILYDCKRTAHVRGILCVQTCPMTADNGHINNSLMDRQTFVVCTQSGFAALLPRCSRLALAISWIRAYSSYLE